MKHILLILALSGASFSALASDHIDGPVTQGHRVADLTDFYAFPTPNKPGSLSLILNTYPMVSSKGHFTDKATFTFLIRKASIKGTKQNSKFSTSDEVVINCSFQTPDDINKHTVNCKSTNGLAASNRYNVAGPINVGDDFRLYAGMRSDPFFFNAEFAGAAASKGIILPAIGANAMSGINCLSIAIEIEMKKLYPQNPGGKLALAVEVITKDSPSSPLRVLDRIGRPEVTNVSMVSHPGDAELRDRYNIDRPFMVQAGAASAYEARLMKNISFYDAIDNKQNWQPADATAMAKLLADDFLVLDMDKVCKGDSFLEIERAMLLGNSDVSCGGRKPTDDIMDKLFTVYIGGLNGARVTDGIDQPNKAISNNFPYLAEPSLDFLSLTKAGIARKLLGLKE